MGALLDGSFVLRLLRRVASLAILVLAIGLAPDGNQMGPVRAKQAAMTFLTIAGIGKILYDTLYYDRFRA
ncbi:MAG: hypothetical protein GX446_08360 [Chthonomonadales bacterium]|nr:hypothetical protein [Chthonomonadales bacterium]